MKHIALDKSQDIKLSDNFSSKEFHCKCSNPTCVVSFIDEELVQLLQELREHFKSGISVTSGHRCHVHNKAVKGALRSQHVFGTAADIKVSGKTPKEVYDYLDSKYPNMLGLGLYKSWVHVDTRKTKARWAK